MIHNIWFESIPILDPFCELSEKMIMKNWYSILNINCKLYQYLVDVTEKYIVHFSKLQLSVALIKPALS